MSLASNIVIKRSTELVSSLLVSRGQHSSHGLLGLSIVILTAIIFGLAVICVEYVCFEVIATLAAVEDPDPTTYLRLESNEPNGPDAPELAVEETTQTVTAGMRSAVRSLYAWGGVWSCFRAFRLYLAVEAIGKGAGYIIQAFLPLPTRTVSPILSLLSSFTASMLLATWQMAWVHLVIADKSQESPSGEC